MENKKTKLTISGNPKNKIKSIQTTKSKGQKTVFIDKRADRSTKKVSFSKSFIIRFISSLIRIFNTINKRIIVPPSLELLISFIPCFSEFKSAF